MLEDFGNAVMIMGRYIPAVNIQVNGMPGFIQVGGLDPVWYGVYFEILWEDASLWIVEEGSEQVQANRITLQEIRNFGTGIGQPVEGPTRDLKNWGEFVSIYDEKRLSF